MEEQSTLFRKESMERIQSPEQLNDYMHVTNPTVWVALAAVILLLVGMLVWGSVTYLNSYVSGTAQVQDGAMVVTFDDAQLAASLEEGMTVTVGESSSTINSIGTAEDGSLFALADTTLADGSYAARVTYKQMQVLRLLFN